MISHLWTHHAINKIFPSEQPSKQELSKVPSRQTQHGRRRESETDSETNSRGLALELVSSPSSDDDEDEPSIASSTTKKQHKNTGVTTQIVTPIINHTYLPNIAGGGEGTAEPLNVLRCSSTDLFPNIKPMYAPRWSSQLPEAYLPNTNSEYFIKLYHLINSYEK